MAVGSAAALICDTSALLDWTAAFSVVHQWQAAGQIGVLKPEIPTVERRGFTACAS